MNNTYIMIILLSLSSLLHSMQPRKTWSDILYSLNPWGSYYVKKSANTEYTTKIKVHRHLPFPIEIFLEKDQEIELLMERQLEKLRLCTSTKETTRIKLEIANLKLRRHIVLEQALRLGYDAKIAPNGRLLLIKKQQD